MATEKVYQDIGAVTAYAYAVSKGYTGTEEQFATELAQFAENAQRVAEDRAAVEELVDEFLNTTAPAVIQDVTDEGTSQVERVANAGTAQVTRVGEAGNTQIDAVASAGTTQIELVTAEGTTQVTRVQDKGDEVIDSIPEDYTALTQEVSDLNQHLGNALKIDFSESDGYYNANGSIGAQGSSTLEKYTSRINVRPGDEIRLVVDFPSSVSMWVAYGLYDIKGTWISRTVLISANGSSYDGTVTIPDDAYAISFCYRTYGTATRSIWFARSFYNVTREFYETEDDVDKIFELTRNIVNVSFGRYAADTTSGVISTVPSSTTQFGLSDKVKCESSTEYTITYYGLPSVGTVYAFWYDTDGNFISRSAKGSTCSYTVTSPSNAKYVYTFFYLGNNGVPSITGCKIQIEKGSISTDYIEHYSAIDNVARGDVDQLLDNIITLTRLTYETYYPERFLCHFGNPHYNNQSIPSQSVFDIERAAKMGFKAIEFNVMETQDHAYIVGHGLSGKFGTEFFDVDGVDISDTMINSVTLSYIKTKVRMVTPIVKYQVAPLTLEEALICAKRNGLIPAVQYRAGAMDICDAICGKDNYIIDIYSADRPQGVDAPLASWLEITDKDELLEKCNASGGAYIAGLNVSATAYSNFDLEDWREMFDLLHANNYRIMTAYVLSPILQHTLEMAGIDYIYSTYQIPEIVNGNLCNLSDKGTFADFSTSGTVTSDGELTLTDAQTISPANTIPVAFIGGGCLRVRFTGSIKVLMGMYLTNSHTLTSDGTEDYYFSTYFDNASPTFQIVSVGNTTISTLEYKASKF